jgi:transcriptional regulator with XRE-family HTH domain
MTSSTVTLRIQELAEAKGLALEQLSQGVGISQQTIQLYATAPVEITEEIAADLRKIATELDVSVVELVKPVAKKEAFKLKILEKTKTQQPDLTLGALSEQSGVHILLIEFYSKQPIYQQKLFERKHQDNLNKICQVLGCTIEDLLDEFKTDDLPETKLRFEEFAEERGLTLNDLSLLTGLPSELIDLMATQPIDTSISVFENEQTEHNDPTDNYIFRPIFCKYFSLFRRRCGQ